jgi:hypothetical protein
MFKDLLCNCFKTFENNDIKPSENTSKPTLEINEIKLNLTPNPDNQSSDLSNNLQNSLESNNLQSSLQSNNDNLQSNLQSSNLQSNNDNITIIHGSKTISLPKLDIKDISEKYTVLYSKKISPPIIIPKKNKITDENIDDDGFVIL